MTTTSAPAKGTGGFSVSDWAEFFDSSDGVVNDYSATGAFPLSRINAGNIARIGASAAGVRTNGYTLKVSANHDLTVPTDAGTYYIASMYDPDLNVAGVGGVATTPDGPCRLVIDDTLDTAGGEAYTLLYGITRGAGQNLNAASVIDYRRWIGPMVVIDENILNATVTGWGPWPRGTIAIVMGGAHIIERYIRWPVTQGGVTLQWVPLDAVKLPFPANSPLSSAGQAPTMSMENGRVFLTGNLKRTSNAVLTSGDDVNLGTLPVGWRPGAIVRWTSFAKPPTGRAVVMGDISPSTGVVTLYGPASGSIDWVDLSGINFRAEN